jgi:poly(hydroxyalkanoate) depolymerase family esterase
MTIRSVINMKEAIRLTREGRLEEAMAVLNGATTHAGHDAEQVTNDASMFLDMMRPFTKSGNSWSGLPTTGSFAAATRDATARFPLPSSDAALDRVSKLWHPCGPQGLFSGSARSTPSPRPAGARFDEHSFANSAGSRTYKLYIPSRYNGEALSLVVMLHGCTQSPDDFAAGTRMNEVAEEYAFFAAYPAQSQSANPSKCWNWFDGTHQQREHGEPSLIAGITRQIMSEFRVESERVYVAGLSAGGAAAAIMGMTYPDLYSGIGVHSGLACGAARDIPSAFAAMRQGGASSANVTHPRKSIVPTIVFHGDGDRTVNSVNGDEIIAQSEATSLGITTSHGKAPGGMSYTRTVRTDDSGRSILEQWVLHGAGHAWSGGSTAGSYTEPRGPDASREMIRFFLQRPDA